MGCQAQRRAACALHAFARRHDDGPENDHGQKQRTVMVGLGMHCLADRHEPRFLEITKDKGLARGARHSPIMI